MTDGTCDNYSDRNSKRGIFYLTRIIVLHAYWTDGVYAVNTNALHASAQLNMEKKYL